MTPVAMTIAGSDPSGGAGLQADLKTFHQHGVYGTSIVTLLTVQNTRQVALVKILDPTFVLAQLDAVLEDIPPQAAKTGALGNGALIEAVADRARTFTFPLVVDPVMVSKHGASLIDDDAIEVFTSRLLSRAFLLTPNLHEASRLADMPVTSLASMERAAAAISRRGVSNVLVKGGQLEGPAFDLLWTDGRAHRLPAERVDTPHTHGTGCVLSAAITARLAKGDDLITAVTRAKRFITAAIGTHPNLGQGHGPVNMHSDTTV
jgi:hydroxymethylpyrimidine/phosphomethylpyrimidine kinase